MFSTGFSTRGFTAKKGSFIILNVAIKATTVTGLYYLNRR
jgi:hypothetical protein